MNFFFHFFISILSFSLVFNELVLNNEGNGELDAANNEGASLLIDEAELNDMKNEEIKRALDSIKIGQKTAEEVIRDAIVSKYDKESELQLEFEIAVKKLKQKYDEMIRSEENALEKMQKTEDDKFQALVREYSSNAHEPHDKDHITEYLEELVCPYRLKYAIETTFDSLLPTQISETFQRQAELDEELQRLLYSPTRERYLFACLRKLSSLRPDSPEFGADFADAWEMLKNIENGLPKPGTNFNDTESSVYSLLLDDLVNMYHVVDQSTAERIWCEHYRLWEQLSRHKDLRRSTKFLVQRLTRVGQDQLAQIAHNAFHDGTLKQKYEYMYALDIMRLANFNITDEQHKLCLWAVYNSERPEIERVFSTLVEYWPIKRKYLMADRINSFCKEYSALRRKVSLLDYHVAGLHPPDLRVRPTYEMCKEYVNTIGHPFRSVETSYVAQILLQLELTV